MQFRAFLVKQNASLALNVSLIGVLLFLLSIFGFAFPATENIALTAGGVGLFLVVVGAFAGKGKGLYEVDQSCLVVDEEKIQIEAIVYPMASVSQLRFHYDSFYSQSTSGYYTEHTGRIEYGITNWIYFRYDNKEITARFYLAHIQQADEYFALLAYLKEKGIRVSHTSRRNW